MLTGVQSAVTPRFPDGASVDRAAVFGNLQRSVGERHDISGGIRVSSVRTELPAGESSPGGTSEQTDFSADVGWITNLSERTQLTANLGYGFRAPNVFDLGALGNRPGNRFNIPNPGLDSERITHFDVGVRHRGEFFDVSVVGFALHYTDRIASVFTGDTTPKVAT